MMNIVCIIDKNRRVLKGKYSKCKMLLKVYLIFILINSISIKKMTSLCETGATRKKLQNYSYNMGSNIGKGYSSQVFKGKNDITNQYVAIKVIDMKMIKGEVHKNLLASEIDVLKSLKHQPNIIQLFDIYTTKNNTYIITELCDQGDLAKHITHRKSIPQGQAIDLMSQIINGYNNISRNGIIHRDLKPANIFLRNQQIKIADFGFAMKNTDSKKYSSYNVGSPIYMPPEALNDNKYSFKSDIWALGVIFYQMLTGKTPWKAKTQKQLGRQLLSVSIQKLLPKSLTQTSIDFLKKTLSININDRMSPDQLSRFCFFVDKMDKQSTKADLLSTNSITDARNFLLKSNNRIQTSLNRNTVTTPKNVKRFNFLKNTTENINDLKQNKPNSISKQNFQSAKTKTQFLISATSNQSLNSNAAFSSTQKSFSNFRSTNNITIIDKKLISKNLLSQIHFCRFLYKLLMRIQGKLSEPTNEKLVLIKEMMHGLLFEKLQTVEELKLLTLIENKEYRETGDYVKIVQIVHQYQAKYLKDLKSIRRRSTSPQQLRQMLNDQIIYLYRIIEHQSPSEVKQQVIVLDYLITLRQLLLILEEDNIQNFHNKAKIEQIVQGAPAQHITAEHILAISQKLKNLKIL